MEPIFAWSPTIAPAGIDYYNSEAIPEWQNALILTTLKESDLRVLKLNASGEEITSEEVFLNNQYGRLRDICISPDGAIYVSTSNEDGRGNPAENDDRILKVYNAEYVTALIKSNVEENRGFYPNPVNDFLYFNTEKEKQIRIYNMLSETVLTQTVQDKLDISNLESGYYILEIKNKGEIERKNFVKK